MTEPTLDTLTQRLDRLEREVRRWRLIVGVLTISLVGLVMTGASANPSVPFEIKARRIVIVNYDNKPLVEIGGVPGFPASVALLDRTGHRRVLLGVGGAQGEDPTLTLSDQATWEGSNLQRLAGVAAKTTPGDRVGEGRHSRPSCWSE